MPLNTGKKVINDCCFIDFNRKQNEGKRIMQKLIRIKTANEALYIGRLLPKNPKKRKKRKNRSIFILTRQKQKNYSYCRTAKKVQNKRKFITRAKI